MNPKSLAKLLAISLLASSQVFFLPWAESPAKATPQFVYNDESCDLSSGSGSSGDPYLVSNADQLWEIADCDITNSAQAYFALSEDIDVSTASLASTDSPIGLDNSNLAHSFSGILEGNNHSITNINISSSASIAGLFALLQDATIKNLSLFGSVSTLVGDAAGSLAAKTQDHTLIQSVSNHVNVSGGWRVGGLIGVAGEMGSSGTTRIISSRNFGNVAARQIFVGGLVGFSGNSLSVSDSLNRGAITAISSNVGGLVGIAYAALTIERSTNQASVSSGGDYIGGLVGYLFSPSRTEIFDSYNSGSISGASRIGGLVGESGADRIIGGDLRITSTYNSGDISGQSFIDGLIGFKNAGEMVNTFTLVPSQFTSSSTLEELQSLGTYVGFDFSNVWGFGPCTANDGLPLLRNVDEVQAFSSIACEPSPVLNQVPSEPRPTQAVAPKIPIFDAILFAKPGESIIASGLNFELFEIIEVSGLELKITNLNTTSMTMQIPELAAGVYDLKAQTKFSRVTYLGQLRVMQKDLLLEDFILQNINPQSSWLNQSHLTELARKKGGAKNAVCIAYQKVTGIVARRKAISRAAQACNFYAIRGIRVKVVSYPGAPSLSDQIKLKFEH